MENLGIKSLCIGMLERRKSRLEGENANIHRNQE
jgi:hypothetical protein